MSYEGLDAASGAVLPAAGHRPPQGTAEVWLLRVTPAEQAAAERLAGVLDAEERRRAEAFLRPADRALYLVAHVGLRLLLGAQLGLPPGEVRLHRAPCPLCGAPHGRPEVAAEPPLHFSLSHAGTVVLCAVAGAPVGVDVDAAAHVPGSELVDSLHPAEREAVRRLPAGRQAEAFLRCWVRKEAYLKGIGTGLGVDPSAVEVGLGPGYAEAASPLPDGWALAPVPVPPGHAAALALRHDHDPVIAVRPLLLAEARRLD